MEPLTILAIDPGDTTGWFQCDLSPDKVLSNKKFGTWRGEHEPARIIDSLPPNILVVENYLIRPPKMRNAKSFDHSWNKGSTLRIIGSLQTVADLRNIQFKLQEPSIKPVGYGYAGLTYVKGKQGTHIQDACAHLAYFLYRVRKVPIDTIANFVKD